MANPTEAYPASATTNALNGTTDAATGLEYIALNTGPGSSPPLMERIDRRASRMNDVIMPLALRVCRVDDTHIGCYAGVYRLAATDYAYAGEASVVANPSGDDTYYVYLTSTGLLQVVTDATGWPVDITTYIPLAEVVVSGGQIATITDVRGRVVMATPQVASLGNSTNDTSFTLDADNGGAGATCNYKANRGSSGGDAAFQWDNASSRWVLYDDIDLFSQATLQCRSLELNIADGDGSPLTVESQDKVDNLNADMVDGVNVAGGGTLAPGGVAYAAGSSGLAVTAAGTAGQVLLSGGAGTPTWETIGTTVQAHDADLDAIAGISGTGVIARTGAGTAAARTLTAGDLVTVTNGDGVAGNPVIGVQGGTTNTVICGNTGSSPVFRQIVDADISNSAGISGNKLQDATVSEEKLVAAAPLIDNGVARGRLIGGAVGFSPLFCGESATETSYASSSNVYPSTDLNLNCINNTGASALVVLTVLGTVCVAGTLFMLKVTDADGLKLVAPSGCKIRDGSTLGASGGYITSTDIGSVVMLQANADGTELWVINKNGTWSVA